MAEITSTQLRYYELKKVNKFEVSICFIGTYRGKESLLIDSIESISEICADMNLEFEIRIIDVTGKGIGENSLVKIKRQVNTFTIYESTKRSKGEIKNLIIEETSCSHICLFDCEKKYEIEFADLIYNFVRNKEKNILFSDILIIPKDLIAEKFKWSDLDISEDIEFLAKLCGKINIIFYPTEGRKTFERFLIYRTSQVRSLYEYKNAGKLKKFKLIGDMINGCNYRYRELSLIDSLWRKPSFKSRLSNFFAYAYFKLSSNNKRRKKQSNYVIIMENMIESVLLGEYLKFNMFKIPVFVGFNELDKKFLSEKSDVWKTIKPSSRKIFEKQIKTEERNHEIEK